MKRTNFLFISAAILFCSLIPGVGFAQDYQCPYSMDVIKEHLDSVRYATNNMRANPFNIDVRFRLEYAVAFSEKIINNSKCSTVSGSLRNAVYYAKVIMNQADEDLNRMSEAIEGLSN